MLQCRRTEGVESKSCSGCCPDCKPCQWHNRETSAGCLVVGWSTHLLAKLWDLQRMHSQSPGLHGWLGA